MDLKCKIYHKISANLVPKLIEFLQLSRFSIFFHHLPARFVLLIVMPESWFPGLDMTRNLHLKNLLHEQVWMTHIDTLVVSSSILSLKIDQGTWINTNHQWSNYNGCPEVQYNALFSYWKSDWIIKTSQNNIKKFPFWQNQPY